MEQPETFTVYNIPMVGMDVEETLRYKATMTSEELIKDMASSTLVGFLFPDKKVVIRFPIRAVLASDEHLLRIIRIVFWRLHPDKEPAK